MMLIIYYFLPVTGRFINLALVSFVFSIVTLCIWGLLFALMKFAQNDIIIPEVGVILPVFLLFCYANYLYFRTR